MTFSLFTIKILSFASICEALGTGRPQDDISQIWEMSTSQMYHFLSTARLFFASCTFHSILIDSSICRCVSVPNFYHDILWIWPILASQAWHVQSPFFRSVTISGMGSGNIFCLVVIQHISHLPCIGPKRYHSTSFCNHILPK